MLNTSHMIAYLGLPAHGFARTIPEDIGLQFSCNVLSRRNWGSTGFMESVSVPSVFLINEVFEVTDS